MSGQPEAPSFFSRGDPPWTPADDLPPGWSLPDAELIYRSWQDSGGGHRLAVAFRAEALWSWLKTQEAKDRAAREAERERRHEANGWLQLAAYWTPGSSLPPENEHWRTELDTSYDGRMRKKAADLAITQDAQRHLSARAWQEPSTAEFPGTLADSLRRERPAQRHLIAGLWGIAHNLSIEALFKTGKSTLVASAAGSLADGSPFLGFAEVHRPAGTIAVWNCEMDADDSDDYLRPHVSDVSRIIPAHLRWRPVPLLLSQPDRQMAVRWLRWYGATVWIIDTWSRLCAWNGIDPVDNAAVGQLTACLDEVKHEAGVTALAVVSHMPQAAGRDRAYERGLGAQAFSGWVDGMWRYTRNETGQRFLSAAGRGIRLDECTVMQDPASGRLTALRGDREDAGPQLAGLAVMTLVRERPGLPQNRIEAELEEYGRNEVRKALRILVTSGAVRVADGPNRSHLHYSS